MRTREIPALVLRVRETKVPIFYPDTLRTAGNESSLSGCSGHCSEPSRGLNRRRCRACWLTCRVQCVEHTSLPWLLQSATDLFMLGKLPHWLAMILSVTIFFGGIGFIMGKFML